jgi:hypothetical protein
MIVNMGRGLERTSRLRGFRRGTPARPRIVFAQGERRGPASLAVPGSRAGSGRRQGDDAGDTA